MVDKDHELPILLPEGAALGSEPLPALFHPQEIMLGHVGGANGREPTASVFSKSKSRK